MQKKNFKQTTNTKSQGKKGERGSQKGTNKFSNDPSWYSVDATIMRDSASLPYGIPAGMDLPLAHGIADGHATIPGVMAYELMPTIGYTADPTDPVNIAATQCYTFVRHANSGSANYDAPDLMLYFLGMADVYSYIEYLRRMYGVVQVYAQKNKYIPYTLLAAMKVEPQSLINNLANFRLGLNMLINKAASFVVPNTMSLFMRRQFLYSGIYTEGNSIRDQLYLFTPWGFSKYDWENAEIKVFRLTAAGIKDHFDLDVDTDHNGLFNAMDLISVGHAMVDHIINNEDMGIMNGDIMKAYGDNVLKLSHLSEDYAIAPVHDPYVLEQMQNATILRDLPTDRNYGFPITSTYANGAQTGTPVLVSEPRMSDPYTAVASITVKGITAGDDGEVEDIADALKQLLSDEGSKLSRLITTQLTNPEPKDNMEITRLTAILDASRCIHSGTEICMNCYIYANPYKSANHYMTKIALNQNVINPSADMADWLGADSSDIELQANWCASQLYRGQFEAQVFKYRPTVYAYAMGKAFDALFRANSKYTSGDYINLLEESADMVSGNISNYTVINEDVVKKMHLAAIMNEFATPHVALKEV